MEEREGSCPFFQGTPFFGKFPEIGKGGKRDFRLRNSTSLAFFDRHPHL
jgi:hypothetical protein